LDYMESTKSRGISGRVLVLTLALMAPALAAAQGPATATPKSSGPQDGFQARMQTAAWLYEELEYEQALKALSQARTLAKTGDERTRVALFEGIVLADLGQRPQSLTAFREALSLNLEARLPVKVSPKVERDFEAVRAEIRTERIAQARAKAPLQPLPSPRAPASAADRPVLTPEQESERIAIPAPIAPGVDLSVTSTNGQRARRIRSLPVVLLGAGVVAGGVGSYFGLRSQGNIQDAREANLVNDQAAHLDEARGQALAANILFGVAVTAAAGAVITWLTANETAQAEEVSR
jgi:tetratricopeptide (TPR) repeat protein